ncbi:hypothetical protein ACFOD4_19340 [Pseudoroseomonas globiformis]|uniref:Uncharacterized protein n=1 Tax=Teichococcus globiformis TaxID=2307229 RepID=A0ABV7G5T7_9PROT
MSVSLMPTEAERMNMRAQLDAAYRTLIRVAADPCDPGWDLVWEAGYILNRPHAMDTPDRERLFHDRVMEQLAQCIDRTLT